MGTKRSDVDRVLDELRTERAGLDKTIARIETARAAAVATKKTRKKKDAPLPGVKGVN